MSKIPEIQEILSCWFTHEGASKPIDRESFVGLAKPLLTSPPKNQAWEKTWKEDALGRLALTLIWDQGPRMCFEDERQVAWDKEAQKLASQFEKDGLFKTLSPHQQIMALFPFFHSENVEDQHRFACLSLEIAARHPEYESYYWHACERWLILQRFGRIPWRNALLKRESTEKEWEYMVHSLKQLGELDQLQELKDAGMLPQKYWSELEPPADS